MATMIQHTPPRICAYPAPSDLLYGLLPDDSLARFPLHVLEEVSLGLAPASCGRRRRGDGRPRLLLEMLEVPLVDLPDRGYSERRADRGYSERRADRGYSQRWAERG